MMGCMIRLLPSALRHGIEKSDILQAWNRPIASFTERDDPLKVIRLGFDSHARLLEVGGEIYSDGQQKIFHAMVARRVYTERIGWR